jgi:restriction system protein
MVPGQRPGGRRLARGRRPCRRHHPRGGPKLVGEAFPNRPPAFHANHTGQLNALRNRIAVGDVVVLPLKTTGHLALGTVTRGYEYLASEPDATRRHSIGVDWTRTDVPRSAVKQDLLYSLGSVMTICEISRNDGAWRLAQVLKTGQDPGARTGTATPDTASGVEVDQTDSAATEIDVVQVAADRIQVAIGERFAGHRLADLVAAVLTAEGYVCDTSPPGPDGGIDIVAGRGPLGLDKPTVTVQVKSQTAPVGIEVVNQLLGACAALQATQALLVAWGGLTRPARQLAEAQRLNLRVGSRRLTHLPAQLVVGRLYEANGSQVLTLSSLPHLTRPIREVLPRNRTRLRAASSSFLTRLGRRTLLCRRRATNLNR